MTTMNDISMANQDTKNMTGFHIESQAIAHFLLYKRTTSS